MSLFDNLKKDVSEKEETMTDEVIDETISEEQLENEEEPAAATEKPKKNRKGKGKKTIEIEIKQQVIENSEDDSEPTPLAKNRHWLEPEGQLMVDFYQTDKNLIIRTAIAGIKPEELEISIEKDLVKIRGERKAEKEESNANYFYQECWWGAFSREVILPAEVDPDRAEAVMKDGVLTIKMPKINKERKKTITIKKC